MCYIIGVIGGSRVNKSIYRIAYEVGKFIAKKKGIVVCGGLTGVMEAACKGAKEENGLTIGILPDNNKNTANRYVDIPIPTGIGEARNMVIINTADGLIAIDGKYGTLSEVAFALRRGKPIVGIDTFDFKDIIKANTPYEAVEKIFAMVSEKK